MPAATKPPNSTTITASVIGSATTAPLGVALRLLRALPLSSKSPPRRTSPGRSSPSRRSRFGRGVDRLVKRGTLEVLGQVDDDECLGAVGADQPSSAGAVSGSTTRASPSVLERSVRAAESAC